MPAELKDPQPPKGITGSDALTRCLNILDKVEDDGAENNHYTGELSTRSRVIRALVAFYDVPMNVAKPPDDEDVHR